MAVCNRPVDRDALIEAVGESLPDLSLTTVRVSADTTDLLDEVTRQTVERPDGPIMLVDLEKAVPSRADFHPILQALNLQRPKWPALVPRPVVLWMPDYLLGLFSRQAPDFFDWRSDTFFFPAFTEAELRPLLAEPWRAGTDGRLSEPERRARIDELRSRLASLSDNGNPFVRTTRADWLAEQGNHLKLLGELEEAEQCYSLALEINESLGQREGTARAFRSLGVIYRARGDLDRAESMHLRSLEINESLGHREGMAADYGNLGLIYHGRGDLDRAESMHRKSLEIEESLGHREGMAADYGNLGLIYRARGDLDRAESTYRKALEMNESLGRREGMATAYANLGAIDQARGNADEAKVFWLRAHKLFTAIGMPDEVQQVQGLLDSLPIKQKRTKKTRKRGQP